MENTNVENVNKEPMTTKQKVIFGLKIAGNVIFYAVIILLFLFSIMNINAGGKGGIPNLFGKGYLSVQSNSMTISDGGELPEKYNEFKIKNFQKGDLLKVDMLSEKEKLNLKLGDVITFETKIDGKVAFNTHRIVSIKYINGKLDSFSTQGDRTASIPSRLYDPENVFGTYPSIEVAKQTANQLQSDSTAGVDTFSSENLSAVKAKVTSVSHGAGNIMDNIQQNWLFYFVLPVLALLLFEVFMVIKNFMDLRAEKNKASLATDKEAMMAELASEKEKMRQELLAELKAQQEATEDSKKDEESDK